MSESEKANQLVSPEAQVMASEQDVNDGLDRIGEALVEKNAQIDSLTAEVERLKKECASRRPAERRVRPMSKQSEAIVDAISKQCIDGFWFDCKKAIAIVDSHVASLTADNERLRVGIRDMICEAHQS